MFSKNLLKSTLSKKQKTITHKQQTAKLYVPMWLKKKS